MSPHPRFVGIRAGDHRKNNVFLIRGGKITAHFRGDVCFSPPTPPGWVSVRDLLDSISQASATEKFKVITTFTIIADMAKNVAGDAAEVSSITKPGAEIHEYQPTPWRY